MPPPNTPEVGVAAPTAATQPQDIHLPQQASPHASSTMANASQGESPILEIDYQSIEYLDPVDDTLMCPVCKTPFHSPITTPCGHTFCAECINRALESQSTCPIDRIPINKDRDYARLPLIIKDQLDRLRVRCPNKGCDHECPRENLEGHYDRRCEFTPVRCPDPGCAKLTARRDATADKGCLHVDIACEFCDKIVVFTELDAHYDADCEGAMTQCPDCETTLPRHRLEKHRTKDCPDLHIQCRWQMAGCKLAGKRRNVEEHMSSGCSFEAVGHLMEQHEQDRKTIRDLNSRLSSLEFSRNRRRERRDRRNNNNTTTPNLDGTPPSPDTAAWDSQEDYMLAQFERLEAQMADLRKQTQELNAHLSTSLVMHTSHVSDQLANLASQVGVLHMHTSWLMGVQRQQQMQTQARTGGSSATGSSGGEEAAARPGPAAPASTEGGLRHQGVVRRGSDGGRENRTRL
ncbi:TNF receptor-associated factor 6 [Staphylotrichum tortipilum]|uniref:TNF receptor-associated factor 6 n=1 Tax=Staphylotrichum tortipilum TaxID=2831512 RepID=A0AAN6MD68_9PEZI|nr:TNF receptor-associated factor 6 [Staphylotrichum longicolle]